MALTTNPVLFRIEWCGRHRTKTHGGLEHEGWRADEDGLRDGLLTRDHTSNDRHAAPGVLARYVLGFHDGEALYHAAWIDTNSGPRSAGRGLNRTTVWDLQGDGQCLPFSCDLCRDLITRFHPAGHSLNF